MPPERARSRLACRPVGDEKSDHHVAMILVDLEPGILGDGGGNRAAHPAVRSERLIRIGCSSVRMAALRWRTRPVRPRNVTSAGLR